MVLQNALSTIKRQTDSLQEFISNASHELKTPLMQLSSSIDYLTKIDATDKETVTTMKKTIRSMNTLIEDLLLLTRVEASFDPTTLPSVNLSLLLHQTLADFKSLFEQKGIVLETAIIPECSHPVIEQHFRSIVSNLLSNAVKYTPAGTVSVTLTETSLIVTDTGVGISTNDLPFIRDKFRKADKARTQEDSHGLGLYLVKKLVDLYGRTITVQSTVGEGSTFTLIFAGHDNQSAADRR